MEPLTVLAIGDPHFKVSNPRETAGMTAAILDIAHIRKPDIIVLLGDILDRHESIHVDPLKRANRFIADLAAIAPVWVMIGNHDRKNERVHLTDEHPFTALSVWGKNGSNLNPVTIVDKVVLTVIKGHILVLVPYVSPGRFVEALNTLERPSTNAELPTWEAATVIFAHQEFAGAQMGPVQSTKGDVWDYTAPYVVSGHIHDYQELQPNILYTGTPIQHAFGDREDKSISWFIFDSPLVRQHTRLQLNLPRKRLVKLTVSEIDGYEADLAHDLKIIISASAGEVKAILKHPKIVLWKAKGAKVVFKTINASNNSPIFQSNAPPSFSRLLSERVQDNPRLATLCTELFGKQVIADITPIINIVLPGSNLTPVAIQINRTS